MATQGYKKKDLNRVLQRGNGVSVSTVLMDANTTEDTVEIGFPAEKVTLVTTGNLVVTATPKIGSANAHAGIVANNTVSTTTTSNMFTGIVVTRTSGAGKLLILAR
jgi:hypothetical protein